MAGPRATTAEGEVAVYPGSTLRPVPPFIFTVPRGWVLEEAPDALALVRTPEPVLDFWVNAVISTSRIGRAVDLRRAAALALARQQRRAPGLEVVEEKLGRFGDRITFLRAVQLPVPDRDHLLAQVQALFFPPVDDTGNVVDLFQIVGTCPREAFGTFAPIFVKLIESFRFS
jgi:hypothetical protein